MFSSVSSDSRVVSWTIVKNELQYTDMVVLHSDAATQLNTEPSVFTKSAGTCMAFSPHNPGQFLVGTEDGAIRLCSTAYGSKYLNSFLGHNMAVYNIAWNIFHPRVMTTSRQHVIARFLSPAVRTGPSSCGTPTATSQYSHSILAAP